MVPPFYNRFCASGKYPGPPWPRRLDEIRNYLGNPQLQSSFFDRFPLEIRREIYYFYWGRARHIIALKPENGGSFERRQLTSSACVVDSDEGGDDAGRGVTRISEDEDWGFPGGGELRWMVGEGGSWGNHWRCEQAFLQTRWHQPEDGRPDNVAPLLWVCKRM